MFGGSIGFGEILVIVAVGLLLFGAKRLPSIARSLGRAMEEFRRAAREVTDNVLDESTTLPAHPPADEKAPVNAPPTEHSEASPPEKQENNSHVNG